MIGKISKAPVLITIGSAEIEKKVSTVNDIIAAGSSGVQQGR